ARWLKTGTAECTSEATSPPSATAALPATRRGGRSRRSRRTRLDATSATAAPLQRPPEHAMRPRRPWQRASKAPGASECVPASASRAIETGLMPGERNAGATRAGVPGPVHQAESREELRSLAECARPYGSRADDDQGPREESRERPPGKR